MSIRCARLAAFIFSILFLMDGLTKNVLFLYSLRIPERSYFFLKRLRALSIDSFSPTDIPTKFFTSLCQSGLTGVGIFYKVNDSINFFKPDF